MQNKSSASKCYFIPKHMRHRNIWMQVTFHSSHRSSRLKEASFQIEFGHGWFQTYLTAALSQEFINFQSIKEGSRRRMPNLIDSFFGSRVSTSGDLPPTDLLLALSSTFLVHFLLEETFLGKQKSVRSLLRKWSHDLLPSLSEITLILPNVVLTGKRYESSLVGGRHGRFKNCTFKSSCSSFPIVFKLKRLSFRMLLGAKLCKQ